MHLYKKDTLQEEVEEYSNNYPAVVYMILADYNVINEENIKEIKK